MALHRIEESVKVYLLFDTATGKWEIDPVCLDGTALDGLSGGAFINCPDMDEHHRAPAGHPNGDTDADSGCRQAQNVANYTNLPNAHELFRMLADELGYTLAVVPPREV